MSLSKLRIQLTIVYLLLSGLFLFTFFKVLPHFGFSVPALDAGLPVLVVLTGALLGMLAIYRIVLRLHKKIIAEAGQVTETIHRYEALNNATNDAVWDHNLLTGETYYNERLLKIFGYPKDDLINNESWWLDNIHPDDKGRVKQKIDTILNNIDPLWQDEYQFRCKDGSYKIVQDRSYIVRDITGKPVRLIGAMNDVTTERKLQQQITRNQLQHKMNLGKAIIQAHEEERKLIREKLHEDVNQVLASVKLCIHQFGKKAGEDKEISQSIVQLDDVIAKIRSISDYLAPPALEYFGLISSVYELIQNISLQYQAEITLQHENFNEEELDDTSRILLYRCIDDLFQIIVPSTKQLQLVLIIKNNEHKPELILTDKTASLDISKLHRSGRIRTIRHKLEMFNGTLRLCAKARPVSEMIS